MTDRRRAAGRRVRQVAISLRSRGKLASAGRSALISRVTGELAGLAEATAAQAAVVLRNDHRALPRALSGRMRGRLRRALTELAVTIERTATIVAQARTRLAGQMPDGATRLVSLHDPDARPIRTGRTGRPAGVRVQGPGQRQRRRHRPGATPWNVAPPRTVRSWYPPSNGSPSAPDRCPARSPPTAATARPPSNVTCTSWASRPWRSPARPPPRRPARPSSTAAASASWSRRTGCEGRISYLKRCHGWDRTLLDGRNGAAIWCGHGVFARNLVKITALAG
jgi:transposase, IS5 family